MNLDGTFATTCIRLNSNNLLDDYLESPKTFTLENNGFLVYWFDFT